MLALILSLVSGIIFAIGLSISGMINPHKVIGFLNIFGQWDYSLGIVMLSAVGFNLISFKYILDKKPLLAPKHSLPEKKEVDVPLIIGSAIFGIGWGLLGICPGPGIVNLVTLNPTAFIFVGSMILGMLLFRFTQFLTRRTQ